MRRLTFAVSAVLFLSCGEKAAGRLQPGDSLQAELVVNQRAALTPELREPMRPTSDSLRVPLRIDSVRGDSIFGTWYADFRTLGTYGDPERRARPFKLAGTQRSDSVIVVLNPSWTDQDVWLRGQWNGRVLRGRWETSYAPHVAGTFGARIARQSNDR